MKKFLVFLVICVVVLSLGVTTYYFVRNDETLVVEAASITTNRLDEIEIEYTHFNKKSNVIMESMNENIIIPTVRDYCFQAIGAGVTFVKVYLDNNAEVQPIYVQVTVGDGSSTFPFFIDTLEQLTSIGTDNENYAEYTLDKCYKLTSSLDVSSFNDGKWIPIGVGSPTGYTKTFDFGYNTISGLEIESDINIGSNIGLFSKLAASATVKNLILTNCNIFGSYANVGMVAGINNGLIERVSITNCSVINNSPSGYVGGVVGDMTTNSNNSAKIERISFDGKVQGEFIVGGLVGRNQGGIVQNCCVISSNSTNEIKSMSASSVIGGIVGTNTFITISSVNFPANILNCFNTAKMNVTANQDATQFGAIAGKNIQYSDIESNKIYGAYYCPTLNYTSTITALGGESDISIVGVDNPSRVAIAKTEAEFLSGDVTNFYSYTDTSSNRINWQSEAVWKFENSSFPTLNMTGPVVNDNYDIDDGLTISTQNALSNMRNNLEGTYVITADIVLSGEWTPIGTELAPFNGKVYVLNHTSGGTGRYIISGLLISAQNLNAGLFGVLGERAYISGMTIVNPKVSNGKYVGSIAGKNFGSIVSCEVINDEYDVFSDTFVYTSSKTQLNSNYTVGGIVGLNMGSIFDSSASGVIISSVIDTAVVSETSSYSGSISGMNIKTIDSCYGNAYIHGEGGYTAYIGGVSGQNDGSVSKCTFDGIIKSSPTIDTSIAGGIVGVGTRGEQADYNIEYCYSKGQIVSGCAGGIFGRGDINMRQCQTDTTIIGNKIGGLVYSFVSGTIEDCHVKAYLYGASNDAVKGGMFYEASELRKSLTDESAALSYRIFSQTYFDEVGTNYFETKSNIRQRYSMFGYKTTIFNSIYEKVDGINAKTNQAFIKFIFWTKDIPLTPAQVIGDGIGDFGVFTLNEFNSNGSVWIFTDGFAPRLNNVATID